MCVCIKIVYIHVILYLCECIHDCLLCACVCVCVRAHPSHPRNPSASHLWRSQQSRNQAPPPAASQQPMGGMVWDYLGTWVAGVPVSQLDHCTTNLTLLVMGRDMRALYKSNYSHVERFNEMKYFLKAKNQLQWFQLGIEPLIATWCRLWFKMIRGYSIEIKMSRGFKWLYTMVAFVIESPSMIKYMSNSCSTNASGL